MKLIDKSAIVAEIDKIEYETNYEPFTDEVLGKRNVCRKVKDFLDTLEVKEVNLEKEYDNKFIKDPVFGKLVNRNAGISIAKHFFELGLSVSNKEQKGK